MELWFLRCLQTKICKGDTSQRLPLFKAISYGFYSTIVSLSPCFYKYKLFLKQCIFSFHFTITHKWVGLWHKITITLWCVWFNTEMWHEFLVKELSVYDCMSVRMECEVSNFKCWELRRASLARLFHMFVSQNSTEILSVNTCEKNPSRIMFSSLQNEEHVGRLKN